MSVGLLLGGIAGYLYWFYVGCNSGTCAITSKAPNSTAYGVLMGGLIASSVWDAIKKKNAKTEN